LYISHSAFNRQNNDFCQLLCIVLGFRDFTQTEMHTAEPPVPEPSSCEITVATAMLTGKSHRPSDSDHIPEEMIHAGGVPMCSEILKLVNSILSKKHIGVTWLITPAGQRGGGGGEKANSF
jgi:hypothetical protein